MLDARTAVESVFREEGGRIIATLIRISGSFDRAEEALQEALASALSAWQAKGIPQNPGAWITATAHRKLIDQRRRERTKREKQDALLHATEATIPPDDFDLEETYMHFPDDRLRLIFTCCHPALNREGEVALRLGRVGGLRRAESGKAFLLREPTLAQRLVRAKRKIQEAHIPYEVPPAHRLAERLSSVQAVVYLIFNEDYSAATGDQLVRRDLCQEAIRLSRVLCELLPQEPENIALLALMLLQDSRRDARVSNGRLVTLEEQNRSLWDHGEISEGLALVERALTLGPLGPYQLQAAIAALHAQPKTPQDTDWAQIAALYEKLLEFNASSVIALNRAVAIAMSVGLEDGLQAIDALCPSGELDKYYLFHPARADILFRMNRFEEAAIAYRNALTLAGNRIEQDFLTRRLASCRDTGRQRQAQGS